MEGMAKVQNARRRAPSSAAAILWIIALGVAGAVVIRNMAVVLPVTVAAMIIAACVLPHDGT